MFQTYGLLNGGTGALTVGTGTSGTGALTTPSGGGNLYVTAANGQAINLYAPITDNGGAVTLVKSGGGTVTLSGRSPNNVTNSFTGGIVLNGGTLTPMNSGVNANALTVNSSTILDVSQENIVNTTTVSGVTLNNGSILSVQGNVKTFTSTGAVTGTGGISLSQTGGGATIINLNSTANTFTGPIEYRVTPNSGQDGKLTVNSFTDSASPGAGNIRFGVAGTGSNKHIFLYGSGAIAPLTLNNRQIELAGSHASPVIGNNSSQAFTVNTDLLPSGTGAKTLTLQGTGAGRSTFAGKISNGTITNLNITKAESGTWVLSGTNSYNGVTTISGGTLAATLLANGGSPSSLGASPNAATNLLIGNNATLQYLGTGASIDRLFTLNGATVTLNASGSGALSFTNSDSLAYGTANQARTLALTGTNSGNNTLAMALTDNGTGGLSLNKAGAGTWVLTGACTYSGATTVSNGTLRVNSPGSLGASSAVAVKAGGTLGGNGTINGTVTVADGGNLAPGASVGTLTISNSLDLSAMAAGSTGKLYYELGPTNASDSIAVGGMLTIGTDALGVSDFVFTNVGGLQAGTYRLITTTGGISGSLDPNDLTNSIGTFSAVLHINGNNLELGVSGSTGTPPVVAPTLSSYGPRSGSSFPLTFSGPSGQTYQVLSSTNVVLPLTNWNVLSSGTFGASPVNYTDTGATNKQQFYRIQSP